MTSRERGRDREHGRWIVVEGEEEREREKGRQGQT